MPDQIILLVIIRHMHSKVLKGLSFGLSFKFFEYLSFEFEFEFFKNLLQISKRMI
jgi:hypothetical protein